jgi:hypothetical protein
MKRARDGCDGDHTMGACRLRNSLRFFLFERIAVPKYQNGFGDGRLNRPLTQAAANDDCWAAVLREAPQRDLIDNPARPTAL